MTAEVKINYKGQGPHGTMLYWTVIAYAAEVKEKAVERAAQLGVAEFTAPRNDSPPNDWGWVFAPAKMKKKAEHWAAEAKAKTGRLEKADG